MAEDRGLKPREGQVDGRERGQSHVVGVLLLVTVTVLLAAGLYVVVGGLGPEASAVDAVTSAPVDTHVDVEQDAGHGYESVVEIQHVAGEDVDVNHLEIEVVTPNRRARLVDLPVADCPTTAALDGRHTRGDPIFVAGCQWGGVAVESTDDVWRSGTPLTLRIDDSRAPAVADPRSNAGGSLHVKVVDVSMDAVVAEERVDLG